MPDTSIVTQDANLTFAQFARDLRSEALSASTVAAVENMLLDVFAASVSASHAPGIRELCDYALAFTKGEARVWVTGERVSPDAATLINSSMAHALEYDDLHRELPMHTGAVVVPAALAVASVRPDLKSGELIAAIVAGTEILNRLARATLCYRGTSGFRGWNPTSVVAGFAAAAVAGRLLDLDAAGIARAMGLSYAQASGNQQCIVEGALVKRMQAGFVAQAGVRAAWLARAGVTGAVNVIEGKHGLFPLYESGEYDAGALRDGLGEDLEIEKICFKRYPVCGMAQPAMDCFEDLRLKHGFTAEDVESLGVRGSKFVCDMVGRPYRPGKHPEVDAQFNLSYCLATMLQTGGFSLADIERDKVLNTKRRALADTIPVTLDESLKGKWEARVELVLKDGTRDSATRNKSAWQDDRPMSRDDLLVKYRDAARIAAEHLDAARSERLAAAILGLGASDTIGELMAAIAA